MPEKQTQAKTQLKVYVTEKAHRNLKAHADFEEVPMSQIVEEMIHGLGKPPVKESS